MIWQSIISNLPYQETLCWFQSGIHKPWHISFSVHASSPSNSESPKALRVSTAASARSRGLDRRSKCRWKWWLPPQSLIPQRLSFGQFFPGWPDLKQTISHLFAMDVSPLFLREVTWWGPWQTTHLGVGSSVTLWSAPFSWLCSFDAILSSVLSFSLFAP